MGDGRYERHRWNNATGRNDEELRRDRGPRARRPIRSILETTKELGLDPTRDLPLKTGCLWAELWSYNTRTILERELGVKAYDSYGLSG